MGEEDARRKANVTLPLSREITEKSCETSTNSGEDLVQGARRGSGGGGLVFPTEAREARSGRSSEEEDQGRMRHDLFLVRAATPAPAPPPYLGPKFVRV